MLEYRCDWCGRQKKPDDTWILGLALERKGVSGSRRQFETLRNWNGKWASHPLAVHLCCEQHKKKYLDALFASPWPAVSRGEIARAAHLRRTEDHSRKDDGATAAEWYIEVGPAEPAKREKKSTQKKKSRPKSCKAEPPSIEFSETDHFHARALGIVLDAAETPNPTKSPEPPESKNLGADDADKSSR